MLPFVCVLVLMLTIAVVDDIKLRLRLYQYEHVWEQIEKIGDRGIDGSFVIDISHVEDHQADDSQHICQTEVECSPKRAA